MAYSPTIALLGSRRLCKIGSLLHVLAFVAIRSALEWVLARCVPCAVYVVSCWSRWMGVVRVGVCLCVRACTHAHARVHDACACVHVPACVRGLGSASASMSIPLLDECCRACSPSCKKTGHDAQPLDSANAVAAGYDGVHRARMRCEQR
jgi:hypothetical protein